MNSKLVRTSENIQMVSFYQTGRRIWCRIFLRLIWSDTEKRWELRVFSDESNVDDNINYEYNRESYVRSLVQLKMIYMGILF